MKYTKEQLQALSDKINRWNPTYEEEDSDFISESSCNRFGHLLAPHHKALRAVLDAAISKMETVVVSSDGWSLTPKQQIVWDWAASHGLTLLADDCNDLLWKLLLVEEPRATTGRLLPENITNEMMKAGVDKARPILNLPDTVIEAALYHAFNAMIAAAKGE